MNVVELTYNNVQTVAPNTGALLNVSLGCPCGNVLHANERANVTIRGPRGNSPRRLNRYRVTANGNIAIPDGGTVGEIQLALAVNGEVIPTSIAATTPAAVEEYDNVTCTAIIDVPICCCQDLSVDNASVAATVGGVAPSILIRNLNVVIEY